MRPKEFQNRKGRSVVSKFLRPPPPHIACNSLSSLFDKVLSYRLRGRIYQAEGRGWNPTLNCSIQGPYHAILKLKTIDGKVQIIPSVCFVL